MPIFSGREMGATPLKSFSKSPRPLKMGFFLRFIMADLTFTTIEESARHSLNISRDEYAACNYIQTWASFPSNNTPGFCNRTRGQMALFIGISERGMQKMLSRLEGMDLIKRASQSQFLYRITERWFNAVVTAKAERTGEQSSRQGVNKVPERGEQSSRQGVNKVPTHKELNKEVYKTTTNEKIDVAVFDPKVNSLIVDSFQFKAEEIQRGTVAPPPAPRRFDPFDIEQATDEMISDYLCFEMYAKCSAKGANATHTMFAEAAREFTKKQVATDNTYPNRTKYREHFFNWVTRKAEIARAQPGATQKTPPANFQTSTRY